MNLPDGVTLKVKYNGSEIAHDTPAGIVNGNMSVAYLGNDMSRHAGAKFELLITCPRGPLAPVAFEQDGKKSINRKRDLAWPESACSLYQKSVFIFSNVEGELYTEFPQNSVRLLSCARNGVWKMYEVSIVCQKGKFYLITNLLYTSQCYRTEEGAVLDPVYKRWTDLQTMLNSVLSNEDVPRISCYRQNAEELPSPKRGEGIVKYFNPAQGWGSVYIREYGAVSEARVHVLQIKRPESAFAYLMTGERVGFVAVAGTRGETKFKCEIFGVSPLPASGEVTGSATI